MIEAVLGAAHRNATAIVDESRAYVRTARTRREAKEGET